MFFFPEGITIKDYKADYLKHPLYNYLRYSSKMPESFFGNRFEDDEIQSYDLWSVDWTKRHGKQDWVKTVIGSSSFSDITSIRVRNNMFDSEEERLLYSFLIANNDYIQSGLQCEVHKDLRDIFNLNKIANKNTKYKLMLMHCDFVFKINDCIVAAVEVDGLQHISDSKQQINDLLKNQLFEITQMPLIRVSASEIRENPDFVTDKVVKQLIDSIGLKDNIKTDNSTIDDKEDIDILMDYLFGELL